MRPIEITTKRLQWTWHLGSNPDNELLSGMEDLALSLLSQARDSANLAYAPYSNFRVGAALAADLKGDNVFCGCNIENASYGATMCAERVAIFSAVAAGEKQCSMIALSTLNSAEERDLARRSPCGLCRQVMSEFFDADAKILIDGGKNTEGIDRVDVVSIDTVLPWRFKL